MHNRKKFVKNESYLKAEKKKVQKYVFLKSSLFESKKAKKYEESELIKISKLLFISPDFTTLWNYRREILLQLDLVKDFKVLQKELELTFHILKDRDLKSYGTWHHRWWLISNFYKNRISVLEEELIKTSRVLSLDLRNFHCWNYRKQVLSLLPENYMEKEMGFLTRLFVKTPSNYSAWHNKSLLLRGAEKEDYEREFKLCLSSFYTDPEDSSSWFFHLFLGNKLPKIFRGSKYCYELLEILEENEKKWPLMTILLNEEKVLDNIIHSVSTGEETDKKIEEFKEKNEKFLLGSFNILKKIDKFRENFYMDKRSDLLIKINFRKSEKKVVLNSSLITRFNCIRLFRNVRIVDFSGNNVKYIPVCLKELDYLEELNLNYNEIEYIYNLNDMKKLRVLKIENNKIEKINEGILLCNSLEEIYLKGNLYIFSDHCFKVNFPFLKNSYL